MKYVLWLNDAESEPYESESIQEAIAGQTLPPETLARLENGNQWEPISALLTKFAHLERKNVSKATPVKSKDVPKKSAMVSNTPRKNLRVPILIGIVALATVVCGIMFYTFGTRQVDVQVFVVTQGGDNIKLGLVEVRAVPYNDAVNALQKFAGDVSKVRDLYNQTLSVKQTLENAITARDDKKSADLANANAEQPKNDENTSIADQMLNNVNSINANINVLGPAVVDEQKLETERQETIGALAQETALADPINFFQKMPTAQIVSKTDADGHCTLSLPKRGRWVIFASAQRSAGQNDEHYVWIVEFSNSGTVKVMLSNDNMLAPFQIPLNL